MPICSLLKCAIRLSHLSYQSKIYQYKNKNWVCKKVRCWTSNYISSEQDELKIKFYNDYSKYYVQFSFD